MKRWNRSGVSTLKLVSQQWNYVLLFAYRFTDLTTSVDQLCHPPACPPNLTLATTHFIPLPISQSVPNLTWQHNLCFANMTPTSSYLEVPMIALIFHIPFRYPALGKYSQPHVDVFLPVKNQAHLSDLLPLRCLIQGKHDWVLYW